MKDAPIHHGSQVCFLYLFDLLEYFLYAAEGLNRQLHFGEADNTGFACGRVNARRGKCRLTEELRCTLNIAFSYSSQRFINI
jgi:hypothetical protein